jgi:transposase
LVFIGVYGIAAFDAVPTDYPGAQKSVTHACRKHTVKRGQSRKEAEVMTRVCVDEKSIGRRHRYATVVISLPEGQKPRVEYVGEDRRQESLNGFWEQLTPEQKAGIEAIAMDMWEPYLESTRDHVPEAEKKIAHDPFHLVRYMNEAVNDVRKEEHRTLMEGKDDRLAGSRFDWLYGMENLPEKARKRLDGLSKQILKTAKAWRLKETFRWFWWLADRENAARYFQEWYRWAMKSRLEPVKKVAKMFQRHLNRILNFFQHRLTNGPIEGINNKIASLIKKAYGYRSFLRFRSDVLFHLGGLDLYPAQ